MAKNRSKKARFILGAMVVLIVALYAVYRMPFVREIALKYKEFELKVVAGEIKEAERRYQEGLSTRPSVHLASIAGGVEGGIRAKMDLLLSELYQAEVTLASANPKLAARILRPRPPETRIRDYRRDSATAMARLRDIANRIEQQRTLLRTLATQRVPATLLLAKDAPRSEQKARVMAVIHTILSDRSLAQNGSAYNLLANLAFVLDRRELVFEYLYRAYLNDPEHLPTIESLGYALWKLNGDCRSAVSYTVDGYQLAWKQKTAFGARQTEIRAALDSLKATHPQTESAVQVRTKEVSELFALHGEKITAYLENAYERLRNTSAYCIAFERITDREQEARAIANELLNAQPADADFLDTKGFVLLRFQKSSDEIRQAIDLFRASSLAAMDSHQKELAEHHLDLARKLMNVAE